MRIYHHSQHYAASTCAQVGNVRTVRHSGVVGPGGGGLMLITILAVALPLVACINAYRMGVRHGADRLALDIRHGVERTETKAAMARLDRMLGKWSQP